MALTQEKHNTLKDVQQSKHQDHDSCPFETEVCGFQEVRITNVEDKPRREWSMAHFAFSCSCNLSMIFISPRPSSLNPASDSIWALLGNVLA